MGLASTLLKFIPGRARGGHAPALATALRTGSASSLGAGLAQAPGAFERYEARIPSAQNCIDAVAGWNSAFPAEVGVRAGIYPLFSDPRISWLIAAMGSLDGMEVLELGPMEAAHTSMLHGAGATVTAIEASKSGFIKCLITKEIMDLRRARFLLGDCVPYLEQVERRYGLIVASGVLYHMPDPLRFLRAVAARTDALFLWTSFIDEAGLAQGSELARGFAKMRETRALGDVPIDLYRMKYHGTHVNPEFCGGIYDTPLWMTRSSILAALEHLGFASIAISDEVHALPHQASFSLLARRS